MYQSDRGNYRKNRSVGRDFRRSCLGRIIICAAILAVIALLAVLTRPNDSKMHAHLDDDVKQALIEGDSIQKDGSDIFVSNIAHTFTEADREVDEDLLKRFYKYNRFEYYQHSTFATIYAFNNFHSDGIRCAIGAFGLVVPLVDFNELMPKDGVLRKEYDEKLIKTTTIPDDYMGENPHLKPYHYKGDLEN